MKNYTINERFQTRIYRSPRVIEIAEAFGLGLDEQEFVVFDNYELPVAEGDVIYITGQSGGGKSVLLRNLSKQFAEEGKTVVNLDEIELDNSCAIIDSIGSNTKDALRLLSAAGLTDAFQYLRLPRELSDGQRYRYKIAKAIESKADVWVCDEFMAILDRTTAKTIAYSIAKVARNVGATLMVATTHTDLVNDLGPDLIIRKRFREKLLVERIEDAAKTCETRQINADELHSMLRELV